YPPGVTSIATVSTKFVLETSIIEALRLIENLLLKIPADEEKAKREKRTIDEMVLIKKFI
ncbi:MAG: hypothetical protein IKS22_02750, partial [Bacteroidales bacterium]|nr:hypothetical protein [Bacteroidales bacterium]